MPKSSIINIVDADIPNELKSDDSLIALFQKGDHAVYKHLVERYQEKIRNLIFSIFNESDIVDDLAQEVFIKAYEGLPKFRFESSFYTWIYRIAVNRSRDEMRRRKVKRFFTFQPVEVTSQGTIDSVISTTFDDEQIQETIEKELNALPDKYKMPIILKDVEGFSYDEMAEILN